MSEKQFKSYALFKGKKTVYRDNEAYTNEEVADLLNKLYEENEQLKYDNFIFKGVIETFQKVAISERKKLEKENELLKQDNQRQKTLRNKHWREIQARANGYNRIISSLENRIPHHIVEELRNAPLLDCDYEGVESNE